MESIYLKNNVQLVVNAEELKNIIQSILLDYSNSKKEESYISESEVLAKYKVSRPTLWRWNKSGYLVKVKFGAKVMYRTSDVEKILNRREYEE